MTSASLLLTHIEYKAVLLFSGKITLLKMVLKVYLTVKLLKAKEG